MVKGYHRRIFAALDNSMTFRPLLGLLALSIVATHSLADTPEPPLLVSQDGIDAGQCQDPAAPCRSIEYALQQVGKNGRVNVAGGTYELVDPANVVYMLSGAIQVRGSDKQRTNLVGVPHQFADDLEKLGFHVVVDRKGLSEQTLATHQKIATVQQQVMSASVADDCVGGLADIYPCTNVDLLGQVADRTPAVRGNDIWGFIDLNTHREYAIMGYVTGTAVYDVTDPESPVEVGFVDGQTTTWRDVKVHQFWNATESRWNAYAYVSADASTDGLFIIDLTELPHRVSRVSYASDFDDAHNVYLTDADFSTGLSITGDAPMLILAGSNLGSGRYRNYSLSDPSAPLFLGTPATPADQPAGDRLYMHDGASMIVTDSRRTTDCVNAGASDHCDIVIDFNEDSLDIWDNTDPTNPRRLSRTEYPSHGYSHSGWPTEDQQYVFLQDETDEQRVSAITATTLRVFDVSDLTAPVLAGVWSGPDNTIDHNGFVRGNRYYMSNYTRGLTIFDITDPPNPFVVGSFDSYPASNSNGFPGAWGTYPYLPSGTIVVSDRDSGLYLLRDNTLAVPQGTLSFSADSYGADESQNLVLDVQRSGGAQGAVSVDWEVLQATADGTDITLSNGTLNWADTDSANKSISIGLNNDGAPEGLERIIVRLVAPSNGATLSSPSMASGWIADSGGSSVVAFASGQAVVAERGFGKAVAVVQRTGSASGAVAVDFAVTSGDAASGSDYTGATTGTLSWADGDANPKWIEFDIADDGASESDEFFELTLSNPSGATLGSAATFRAILLDGTGATSAPNAMSGASQVVAGGANVTLDGSGSNDPQGDTLAYSWTQTLGPNVALTGDDTATASFTAPNVSSDTMLRFELMVTDTTGLTDTSTTTVTVQAPTQPTPPATGGGGGGAALWLVVLLALFERVRANNRLRAIRAR